MTLLYGNENWKRFCAVANKNLYYGPKWKKYCNRKNFYMHLTLADGCDLTDDDILSIIKTCIDYTDKKEIER